MLHCAIMLAVALAAFVDASYWALLCGVAALSLLTIAGEGVMTRVLVNGDDDDVHYSLRQIMANALWTSSTAFALGLIVRMFST